MAKIYVRALKDLAIDMTMTEANSNLVQRELGASYFKVGDILLIKSGAFTKINTAFPGTLEQLPMITEADLA